MEAPDTPPAEHANTVPADPAGGGEPDPGLAHDVQFAQMPGFRTIADQAPVMMWISGPDMRPTWFNRRWLEFVGHTLEEEIRDQGRGSVHPEDLPACLEAYERSFAARCAFD